MSFLKTRPFVSFFSYPLTWLAFGILVLLHLLFMLLFQPTLLWSLLAVALDLAGLVLWFVFAFKSESFRRHLNRMPYENRAKDVLAIINACEPNFKKPALESMELIQRINKEFSDRTYSSELALMVSNIQELALNYQKLSERALHFGNAEQKKRMNSIMTGQRTAVNNTLNTLRTFGGNLTLIAANEEQSQTITEELKDLNEGLKEVIEEL
jgi:hypothetical protein